MDLAARLLALGTTEGKDTAAKISMAVGLQFARLLLSPTQCDAVLAALSLEGSGRWAELQGVLEHQRGSGLEQTG